MMLESFLRLLNGEKPDEIIWTADLEYWLAGRRMYGSLDTKYEGERGRLRLSQELGILPYYWYEQFWLAKPEYDDVEVITEHKGGSDIRKWRTPVGEIEEVSEFTEESCSQAVVKHSVRNEDDLKILLYILEHRELKPANLDDYEHRRELYAEYDGIPSVAMPRSPISALAVEWCGIENLTYLIADCPELVARVFALFEQQEEPIIDAVCKVCPPLVLFADNITSDFYTPFFDKYMKGPYRKRLDALHSAGVKCAVHLDGTVRGMLPKLAAVSFDAIEALTPAPVGDVPLETMRGLAKSEAVILWGGMPGAMFCKPYTWDDVEKHLEKLFDCWGEQRFVLGMADQIPANGDIEICRKISEMVTPGRHK